MRDRIKAMRRALVEKVKARAPGFDLGFVMQQRGMFSYSGLSKEQVHRLRKEFSVYAIDSGRICVAALNPGTWITSPTPSQGREVTLEGPNRVGYNLRRQIPDSSAGRATDC